jgi:hypothetical protein
MNGERTGAGDFGDHKWRHATEGGWFSWQMKVLPDQPQELWVTYWGSDVGNRVFDILVDGQKIGSQRLDNNKPDKFFEEVYRLPADLLTGKQTITVKFQAHPGAFAGGVFGVRVMRADEERLHNLSLRNPARRHCAAMMPFLPVLAPSRERQAATTGFGTLLPAGCIPGPDGLKPNPSGSRRNGLERAHPFQGAGIGKQLVFWLQSAKLSWS